MTDSTISNLPNLTTPDDAVELAVNDSNTSKKVTKSNWDKALIVDGVTYLEEDGAGGAAVNNGALTSGKNMIHSVVEKTANYTANEETYILCDATSASFQISLPTAVGNKGKTYTIKKIDSSANTITIDGNSTETIDGAVTQVLTTQYDAINIISDDADWMTF